MQPFFCWSKGNWSICNKFYSDFSILFILFKQFIIEREIAKTNKKNRKNGGKLKSSLGVGKKTGTDFKRTVHVGIQNAHEREVVYGYYQEYGYSRGGKAISGKKWMKKSFDKSIKKANEKIKETTMKEIMSGIKK